MPEPESPQVRRDRVSSVILSSLVCLAAPSVALLAYDIPGDNATRRTPLVWLVGSALVGAAIPFLYWAPYRALGLVTYGALWWLAAAAHGVCWHEWPGWAHGLPLGLIIGALARGRRGAEPVEDNYMLIASVLVGAGIAWGFVVAERPFTAAGYLVLALALGTLGIAITRLFRPLFELTLEPWVWFRYALYCRGPGLENFPRTGPCLILANHACWLDPLFLAKFVPRPITPMMTERFYDQPVIRRLMVSFGVIRVPEKAMKKDTPEIREAIAALDRGECVVIFPEGYLRRSEERMLRRFGQGVWQILQAKPDTPVYACWIEGGWGSFMSYFNGPPTKNKAKKDVRRPLGIGISAPITIPREELAEHLRTRIHLMNLVLAAREHLGLPPLPLFELPAKEDSETESV
jgi:1-acyl-sn-glycerol-3-phosphate acyltransferase